jgi:hypothetical protein
MSAAEDWVNGLTESIREFSRTRGSPVVRVHLNTESFNASRVAAGPGDLFVTFDAFPDVEPGPAVLAAMVQDRDGEYHTARVVIASLHDIRSVELLHEPERTRTIGFRAPDDS